MFRTIASLVKNGRGLLASTSPSRKAEQRVASQFVESLESRMFFSASPTIYADDSQGHLFSMAVNTGVKHIIGKMATPMFDIAFSKSGVLYGVATINSQASALYKINTTNASITKVGNVGFFVNALTFGSNGTLYAAGYSKFSKINTTTGKGTVVGTLGSNQSAGDLAFDNKGNLFLTTNADKLIKVNVTNGHATTIGSIGFHQVFGMGFSNGVMYGMSNYNEKIFKINLTTGAGTFLANFGTNVVGVNGASFKF
jgi:hypothetical protein